MNELYIISNDCWGVGVYNSLNMQFASHFVGNIIFHEHYIKLLQQFDYYMNRELSKIDYEESYSKTVGFINHEGVKYYKLGDIEVVFPHSEKHPLHFLNADEDKWKRRRDRLLTIPKDKIIAKIGDLSYENKYFNLDKTEMFLREFYSIPNFKKISITYQKHDYPNNYLNKSKENPWEFGKKHKQYMDVYNL